MQLLRLALAILAVFLGMSAQSQTRKPIFRYPHVSEKEIVFGYANDLWIVSKNGGLARKLSSPPGPENWARFSPDGSEIAFAANYGGFSNIFTITPFGGLPRQLTYHDMGQRVVDWYPDGKHLLISSSMQSGKQRFSQFFKISREGGLPEKLPIAHAEFGSLSPDGKRIAFTDKTRAFRTWKRYRGGTAPDIIVFNLETFESERITKSAANDEFPMWIGDVIYYLSDQGEELRYNIWKYDTKAKRHTQVTFFRDKDVHFPSAGGREIVFEAGGDIHLLDTRTDQFRIIDIQVVTDFDALRPRMQSVKDYLSHAEPSPDGNRIVVSARGELFNVPVKQGVTYPLAPNAGSAERYPAWSPDGSKIACWSDQNGEYNLMIQDLVSGTSKLVTQFSDGFRYKLHWSPDSKHLVWIDQTMQVQLYTLATGKVRNIGKQRRYMHYALNNFYANWSSDSQWLAFLEENEAGVNDIVLYEVAKELRHMLPGGMYSFTDVTFDPEGKYLYVGVANQFSPVYSGFDNSFVYTNNESLGAFTLQSDTRSPLYPENDTVAISRPDSTSTPVKGEKETKKKESREEKKEEKKEEKRTTIDMDGLSRRLVMLPVRAGNYGKITGAEGKLVYLRYPNSGEPNGKTLLHYYDLKEREEKKIVEGYGSYQLSANGKKILIANGSDMSVVDVAADQKADKKIDLSGLMANLDPAQEWQQLFADAWRIQRDFFYDKDMHQLDWMAVRKQYEPLIARASTRADVNYVIGELIGELNASHAYRGGGDAFEKSRNMNMGYLGINWERKDGQFAIREIIRAADWDMEDRSPLAEPGLGVKEGMYILAVNGQPLAPLSDPSQALAGLADKVAELTIHDKPQMEGSRKILVKLLGDETRLRNLAWIESNRRYVEKASGGRIGYIYVPSTGLDGQYELVRMFYGQYRKPALIVDERFNNGGQIPDRFVELLNRKPLAFWKTRDGADWQWPPVAHFGPKAMLINGWSGSGGDAFPDYFRKSGLGPLIGTRTWGGLIGISGAPELIDGGSVSAPTFRMYHPDGSWFPEGHGVDPDMEVLEDYSALARGRDAQLDKAIEHLLKQLDEKPFVKPEAPAVEKRN